AQVARNGGFLRRKALPCGQHGDKAKIRKEKLKQKQSRFQSALFSATVTPCSGRSIRRNRPRSLSSRWLRARVWLARHYGRKTSRIHRSGNRRSKRSKPLTKPIPLRTTPHGSFAVGGSAWGH